MRQVRRSAAVVILAALCGCTSTPPATPAGTSSTSPAASMPFVQVSPEPTAPPGWSRTGQMSESRVEHSSTLLRDGRVLVAGGFADGMANDVRASAEIYEPASRTWTRTGDMVQARAGQTATLLTDGTVLVTGGATSPTDRLKSAEIYHPATGTWTAAPEMGDVRASHTATLLLDGRVLVVGGENASGPLASAEIFDPTRNKWSPTGKLTTARGGATAVRLWTGQVLLAGGAADNAALASAEVYDPASGAWHATGSMSAPRVAHASARLENGRVLVGGGLRGGLGGDLQPSDILDSAEVYNPATESWTSTGSMANTRFQFTLTSLDDGTVLAAVGDRLGQGPYTTAEIYDPEGGKWTATPRVVEGRAAQTATLLAEGDVLLAGGEGAEARGLKSAELYDGSPPPVLDLAQGGTMFPGTYRTRFEPSMTLTIDDQVDLDCAPGYRCRGDIDVNLPQWVAFEFGNIHGSELDIFRLDKVYDRNGVLIDPPDDLVAWVRSMPGMTEASPPEPVVVGGIPGTRIDIHPSEDVRWGPTGLPEPDKFGINGGAGARASIVVLKVGNRVILIESTLGPENTVPDFNGAVRGLEAVIGSIVWN